jgi:arabinose-5-phosphate isomerase
VIHEMSSKRLGMTCIVDGDGRLAGVFTDGDLRRLMMKRPPNAVLALTAGEAMTSSQPLTIRRDLLAVEALRIMETHKITSVVVVDAAGRVEGVVHLHDLWRTQKI